MLLSSRNLLLLLPCVLWIVAYCFGPTLSVRTRVVKMLGRKRVKRGRKRGRQEQMMPTLISTEDQVAAGGLS
jgi:hypothetical protein